MKMRQEGTIRGALYYLSPGSGTSIVLARGVLTGVISTLMAEHNWTFDRAMREIAPHLPEQVDLNRVPESWRDAIREVHHASM